MNDRYMADLLDALTPACDDRVGDWEAVLQDARRRRPRVRVGLVLAVAAAVAVAALAWPLQGREGGILERALAAVGDGPVLHVVLRGDWGGTLVDLETGARRSVHGEEEVWYDADRGLVHSITRLGGVVTNEYVRQATEPPAELEALARRYREALETGAARVAGEGTLDGEPIVWITIRRELLPDVADGRDHEWAQQVAVSRRTFEPVGLRETRDGEPGPNTGRRVLSLELLGAGAGDFTPTGADRLDGTVFRQGREPIGLEQARGILGRAPLWLGREHRGLPLAQVLRETTSSGRRREVRITGADARAAEACRRQRGEAGGQCLRAIGRSPLVVRPDGVFAYSGPVVWKEERRAVVLFYGALGDGPSTFRDDVVPLLDRRYVTITETIPTPQTTPGWDEYVPPEGSVFVAAGGRTGILQVDGVRVAIESTGEDAILSAARALEPLPER